MKRAVIWTAVSSQAQADDEKISLPDQENLCRRWCENNDYQVTQILSVKGFSRSESDILELLDDLAKEGVYAYHELRALWRERKFDVLVAYSHSRLGRSWTAQSWVIENVLKAGSQIYLINGGWVNNESKHMQIMAGGFSSTNEIERLVRARTTFMDQQAKRGLPTTSSVIDAYIIVRDDRGKALRIEPAPALRHIIEDAARLVAEGVGWKQLEEELYSRFGHINPKTGRPFRRLYFYALMRNPAFWGHSARHWYNTAQGRNFGEWVFNEAAQPPEGVQIYRNTHEPILIGSLSDRVKAELIRRINTAYGKSRPQRTKAFSGLLCCAECGYYFVFRAAGRYACMSRYWQNDRRPNCNNIASVSPEHLREWFTKLLTRAIEVNKLDLSFINDQPEAPDRTDNLQQEIEAVTEQIRRLIIKQATAPDSVGVLYDEQIAQLSDRLNILKRNLQEYQSRQLNEQHTLARQQEAIAEAKALGVDGLWCLPETKINQILHRLMGNYRAFILDGEIVVVEIARRH
jgi:DNA invertase Pin-like site-specific DNA recombinase